MITGYALVGETGVLKSIGRFRAGRGPAEMTFHPSGRFLYVANWRSSGNISAFRVDQESGALSEIDGTPYKAGHGPRGITLDPNGRFLFVANTQSHSISVFELDGSTGKPTPVPGSPFTGNGLKNPQGFAVVSGGERLLVSNTSPTEIVLSMFSISKIDGSLTPFEQSPFRFTGRCQAGCGLSHLGWADLDTFQIFGSKEGVVFNGFFDPLGRPGLLAGVLVAPPGTSYLNDMVLNDPTRGFILSSEGNAISAIWNEEGSAGAMASKVSGIIPSKFRTDAGKLVLTPVFTP